MERSRDTRTTLLVVAGLIVAVAGLATIGVHAALVARRPGGERRDAGGALPGDRRRLLHALPQHRRHASVVRVRGSARRGRADHRCSTDTRSCRILVLPVGGTDVPRARVVRGMARRRRGLRARTAVVGPPGAQAPPRAARPRAPRSACSLVIDLVLIVYRHSLAACHERGPARRWPRSRSPRRCSGSSEEPPSPSCSIAAWREWKAGGDVRSPHPWLAAAWTIAAAGQFVLLARPISYRPLLLPADVWLPLSVAVALLAFLAPQRAEASRARRATDRAQEVMGGRAEIAAMISHEVRGPVSTIRGLAGTALSHYDRLTDDERRELLDLIEQESRRLLATVTQASTALKVDAATVSYDIRTHDFGNTVREGIAARRRRSPPDRRRPRRGPGRRSTCAGSPKRFASWSTTRPSSRRRTRPSR